ncbi:glycosyltransferase family 2 protein [Haliea sp.]|uniref:glycosyltransferase family 2 protein n=1 Tax=Haliea sp. TaxID=1932666 RepID=UPI003527514B
MPAIEAFSGEELTLAENSPREPFFSVIMPTRNRPELFSRALHSVLTQSFLDFEVLVINDGSSDDHLPRYRELEKEAEIRTRWHHLLQRPNGHGPSYSINTGARLARGSYLCILDDDDTWEDARHLETAHRVIEAADGLVDVYYSNQAAYTADNMRVPGPLWLEGLGNSLREPNAPFGTFRVSPKTLLSHGGFPHLNCTIIRRDLFLELGGMDEGIRYECEVDLYLRTLSHAQLIIYTKSFIGRHNVPRADRKDNESTIANLTEKRLSQLRVYQKSLALSQHPDVIAACQSRLADRYKHLAADFKQRSRHTLAALFARFALACRFSIKWQAYTWYLEMLAKVRER